ncbi:MAG TPA: hypothetical protein VLM79_40205 [Kofleriaceae bacterium]|nr:hypothetical protein [Kofleriaceae bacterium]
MDQLGFDSHSDTMLSPFRQSTPDRLIAISRSQLIRLGDSPNRHRETSKQRAQIGNLRGGDARRDCDMNVRDRREGRHRKWGKRAKMR